MKDKWEAEMLHMMSDMWDAEMFTHDEGQVRGRNVTH